MVTYICLHTNDCLIYKNWQEQAKDSRLDIIFKEGKKYTCLALCAIQDPTTEGGVIIGKKLEGRLNAKSQEIECSHIEILNKISKISI